MFESPTAALDDLGEPTTGYLRLINWHGLENTYNVVSLGNLISATVFTENPKTFDRLHVVLGIKEERVNEPGKYDLGVLFDMRGIYFNIRGHKAPYQVKYVKMSSDFRSEGRGTNIYRSLIVEQGITIVSDFVQFNGARFLYAKLSKDTDIRCDIYDNEKEEIILKDYKVDHGGEDWDFDDRIWSYDDSKRNILIVLSKR